MLKIIKMASNQADVPRDILKCVNRVPLLGHWVRIGSTSDLKQKKERFGAIRGINLSLCACELSSVANSHL